MSTANYRYGATTKREYTPAADQVAGDVVVLDDGRIGVVIGGILTGKLGEVFIDGVFDITSATGTTASEGDAAFIDVSDGNNVIPAASAGGSDVPLGSFMSDKAAGELVARVDLNAAAIDNSVDEAAAVTLAGVQTLTNKRIVPRVVALADAATVTPNADTTDVASVAALSQATDIANPTGTPTDGQRLEVRLTTAASQALTYGNKFRSTVAYTLPTATLGAGATQRLVFEWIASNWDLVGYDSQAAGGGGETVMERTKEVTWAWDDQYPGVNDPFFQFPVGADELWEIEFTVFIVTPFPAGSVYLAIGCDDVAVGRQQWLGFNDDLNPKFYGMTGPATSDGLNTSGYLSMQGSVSGNKAFARGKAIIKTGPTASLIYLFRATNAGLGVGVEFQAPTSMVARKLA